MNSLEQNKSHRNRSRNISLVRLGIVTLSSLFFLILSASFSIGVTKTQLTLIDFWASITIGLIAYIIVGWTVFAKPYAALIASKKQLRLAMRETARLAEFPVNNPHPLLQIAQDGTLLFANPAALAYFPDIEKEGFANESLRGIEIYFDDEVFEDMGDDGLIFEREAAYTDAVYHQTITPLVHDNQRSLIVYYYNITQSKHAKEKARLLEAVIVNAKDGVILTTADLHNPEIVFVNDAVCLMTGYEKHEIIGQTPQMFQGSGTNKNTLNELRICLENEEPFKGEILNYTKKGTAYWLDLSIVPVHNAVGETTHFAAIERDITERKAFEKEMQINREAAEVASRAKDDFLANMSHELRTPMNGIIGLSELLTDMKLEHEQAELVEAIHTSSRNLLILLNDILDLSKIEAGELTLETVAFDTSRVIRQTVDLLRPLASKKSVILENTISPIVPSRILGDPARLQQILNNLISNAIKFTDMGYVRLDVTSKRDSSGDPVLCIRVEDSGIGIPEDKQDTVFNKFTQADVSTARKYGGTGLGLTITKELVEMMGGRIGFDSILGKGTTFNVEIPIEEAKAEERTDSKNFVKVGHTFRTNANILIVDDHPVNLLFLRKVLKKLDFQQVDEARSGKEAIEMAENNRYDLIFMDCQMPEIDGLEASTIIREREEKIGDIIIIAVTADAMKGAREKCIDAGMNDYISKPVDTDKLKGVLSRWLPSANSDGTTIEEMDTNHDAKQIFADTHPTDNALLVLDRERLEMFTDGDPEEEENLLHIFTTYAVEALQDLKAALKENDQEKWQKAAHKLKGSAANLGAIQLSEECKTAELGASKDDTDKTIMLAKIHTAYIVLQTEVQKSKETVA